MKLLIIFIILMSSLFANDTEWNLLLEDKDELSYFIAIDNADSQNIMAVCNHHGVYKRILKSTDGGFTWDYVYKDVDGSYLPWYRAGDIAYPTKNFCVVSCDTSTFLKTRDSGITWDTTMMEFGRNDFLGFVEIDMFDDNHGLMATIFHMIVTHDGFETWDTIPPFGDPSEYYIFAAEMIDKDKIIMVTRDVDGTPQFNERFYRSDDGGKSWYEFPHPDYRIPMNLHFVDTLVGYEIGQIATGIGDTKQDLIYKTIDGGKSWLKVLDTIIEGGLNFGLIDLDFYDKDNGIVVGNNGKIYWTHNGGKTWIYDSTIKNTEPYGPLTQFVCMISPRSAIICTFDGKIYRGESGISFVRTYDQLEYNTKVYIEGSTARFWIDYPYETEAKIEIVDILGNQIYANKHFISGIESVIDIDVSEFPIGSYLYRIIDNIKLISKGKFIKD